MAINNRLAFLIFGIDILWFAFIACLCIWVLPFVFQNPTSADVVSTIVGAVGVTMISTFLMNITLLVVQFYFRRKPTEGEASKIGT